MIHNTKVVYANPLPADALRQVPRVVRSANPKFAVGELLNSWVRWERGTGRISLRPPEVGAERLFKVDQAFVMV